MPFALNKLFSFGVNYYEKAIDSWVECGVSSRSLKFVQVSSTNFLVKEPTNTIILFQFSIYSINSFPLTKERVTNKVFTS